MIKATTRHLSNRDKLLFYGLLVWVACALSLAAVSNVKGTLQILPLLVTGADGPDSYPALDSPTGEFSEAYWRVGDPVLSIDGIDALGMSGLQALSTLMAQSADGSLEIVSNRGDDRVTQSVVLEGYVSTWTRLAVAVVYLFCGVVALLGAKPTYITRNFYIASAAIGVNGSFFFGLSYELTHLWFYFYLASVVLAAVAGFKFIQAFPHGDVADSVWQKVWPWLLGLAIGLPWVSTVTNLPFRVEDMTNVRVGTLAFACVLAIGFTIRNYRQATAIERSQLKWILLGTFLMFASIVIVTAVIARSPESFRLIYLSDILNVSYPVFLLVAIIGYRAMDVDRVFSAVVTYATTIGIALIAIVGFLPAIANQLIDRYGLDDQTVYLLLSLVVCAGLIPLHRALRPRIEGWFFPERSRLDNAALKLSKALERCESETVLIQTLGQGLADMQGAAAFKTSGKSTSADEGYEIRLQPSVGESVYLQLSEKLSGDVYSDRDIDVMNRLVTQSETLLLKMRNQALTLQRQAAEQLAAEKSLFLASASHDLRQPMHALGLFSESLMARNRDERLDVLVQQIHRSTRSLDSMFNSILDLSKIDAGAMVPEFGPVYVQLLFEELELEFDAAAHDKGLQLTFAPTSAVIYSDANLLARVLRNLISNAIRYTDAGKILIGCRYGKETVRLQVLDTGRGISDTDRARIFTAYARVDKHVEGGLGLGLSLVDKLCHLLEHPLSLESAEGRGSRFSITASTAVTTAKPLADAHQISWPKAQSLVGLKVLAVDDDPAIRLGLTELLTGWGCLIQTQESLLSVSNWLMTDPAQVDLLLVDLHLANRQDGLRILEAVFSLWGPMPAVLITGDAQSGTFKWVNGVQVAIVNKPLGPEKLRVTMQEALLRKPASTSPLAPIT